MSERKADADVLPYVHTAVPVYVRTPSGIEIPCDGPNLVALDDDGHIICTTCNSRVIRTGDRTDG